MVLALTTVLVPDALAETSTVTGVGSLGCASVGRHRAATARDGGTVPVVIVAHRGQTAELLSRVRALGGVVCDRFGRIADAVVPASSRASLARGAAAVRPVPRPYPLGVDEGVGTTNARAWHALGLRGGGVSVAVIDLGFGGLQEAQDAGLLPRGAGRVNFCTENAFLGERHGTAVAEVVAEQAPAVRLHLICVDSAASLARAEAYVVAKRIPIVNHSVGWFNSGPGDGNGGAGTPDAIVADARAHGVLWVNAAGNEVQHHWRGTFTDADADGFLDFAPGDNGNYVSVPPTGYVCAYLRWYEWPTAQHNYELTLYDSGTGLVYPAEESKPSPLATACWGNPRIWETDPTGVQIRISSKDAGTAQLELFVKGVPDLQYWTAAGSIADPAASPNALAVGAVCWRTGALEPFSSQGPTIDGRVKPDLVAPDSVTSPTYGAFSTCGKSGFAGTSASAPHVAGAAALVKQRFPLYSPAGIESYLRRHAVDLGATGPDNLFGAGALLLPSNARN